MLCVKCVAEDVSYDGGDISSVGDDIYYEGACSKTLFLICSWQALRCLANLRLSATILELLVSICRKRSVKRAISLFWIELSC
jgi:hypothetical protein